MDNGNPEHKEKINQIFEFAYKIATIFKVIT
jgi:hypothetical protein